MANKIYLFRSWRPWLEGPHYSYSDSMELGVFWDCYAGDQDSIEQFTGVVDKVGEPIYEGDFVKTKHGVFEVFFQEGRWWLKDSHMDIFQAQLWSELEVVGNIHETPDLLKK